MINYFKNVKNPALKCFLQLFPLFVLFFVWKDWGTEVGNGVLVVINFISQFMSPLFQSAGEYVLTTLVFIWLWCLCVFSKTITNEDDVYVVKFWKNLGHFLSVCLFVYAVLYIVDIVQLLNTSMTKEAANHLSTLVLISGLLALSGAVSNIFFYVKTKEWIEETAKEKEKFDFE